MKKERKQKRCAPAIFEERFQKLSYDTYANIELAKP